MLFRSHLDRLPAVADLPGAGPGALRRQRRAGRVGRGGGAHRVGGCGARVVQAVARRREAREGPARRAGTPDRHLRGVREAPLPRHGPPFHRVRGSGRRKARQEDGGLPPVPRGQRGRGGDHPRRAGGRRRRSCRRPGLVRVGPPPGRTSRRPPRGRRLAHAGLGQEPHHGVLRGPPDPAPRDGEPHHRRADGPERPRRPALRHLRRLPRPAAATAGASRRPRRPGREAPRRLRRRGVHHHPEVHASGTLTPALSHGERDWCLAVLLRSVLRRERLPGGC